MKSMLTFVFISTFVVLGKAFSAGVYRINNVASGCELKSYQSGPSPIIADDVLPGVPYGMWEITKAHQYGFSIRNMGLGTNLTASNPNQSPYVIVDTHGTPATTFAIEPAGFGQYVIKLPYDDLVWTMDPVGNPSDYSIAMMKPADGSPEQRFKFMIDTSGQP